MTLRAPLIGVVVAIALVAGAWFGLYKPSLAKQEVLEQETAELESRQTDLRNEITMLEGVKADAETYRAAVARLEELVPTGVDQAEAVRQLQAAADDASVEITAVTFGEPTVVEGAPDTGEPGTTLAALSISMIVEGEYFQVADFFRRVERDVPRAVLTESANLEASEDGFPRLATTWGGQLFAVVPVAETPAPAPAAPGTQPAGEATAPDGATQDAAPVEGGNVS